MELTIGRAFRGYANFGDEQINIYAFKERNPNKLSLHVETDEMNVEDTQSLIISMSEQQAKTIAEIIMDALNTSVMQHKEYIK